MCPTSATTVGEARWLEAHGADAVIAQGLEAGGHRGHFLSGDLAAQLGTMALVPQVVNAVFEALRSDPSFRVASAPRGRDPDLAIDLDVVYRPRPDESS